MYGIDKTLLVPLVQPSVDIVQGQVSACTSDSLLSCCQQYSMVKELDAQRKGVVIAAFIVPFWL